MNIIIPKTLVSMVTFLYLMIHLWLWIVQPYRNIVNMEDIYSGKNQLLSSIIDSIMRTEERPEFLNLVRQVESGGKYRDLLGTTDFPYGNPKAEAKTTTAKGVYQFTDKSVDTAKTRAKNIGFDSSFIDLIDKSKSSIFSKGSPIPMKTILVTFLFISCSINKI